MLGLLLLAAAASAAPDHQSDPAWQVASPWVQVPAPTPAPAPPAPAPAPGVLSKVFGSVPWWTWDRKTVSDGIFKNENIMIHVGQNMFNFVFSTLAWFTVSQIYSLFNRQPTARAAGARSDWGRALTLPEAADEVLTAIRQFEEKQR